jgi:hypothetical protein
LEELPLGKNPISWKWVYRTKYKVDGLLDKHKVMLVAKVLGQQEGVDDENTFVPTTKLLTIEVILVMYAHFFYKLYQRNVKCAFLNEDLEKEVYMDRPQEF